MADYNDKRRERETKRDVKRIGNKSRRRTLKKSLEDNPEEADLDKYHFDTKERSKDLNDGPNR